MIKIYGDLASGNCYKVKLLATLLNLPHTWQHVDIMAGATRVEAFTHMNPNLKIPVLEISPNVYLSESNAILNYLAEGTSLLPSAPLARARVLQWQFFEQYSHEPYIAVARFIAKYLGMPADRISEYRAKQEGGHRALQVMAAHLDHAVFLSSDQFGIADISLYACTHVAAEGGFTLDLYPSILRWLARVESIPGHRTMVPLLADQTKSSDGHGEALT